jgi:serine/threonine protein kinase
MGVKMVNGEKALVMEAIKGKNATGLADTLRTRLASGEIGHEEYWATVQYTLAKTLEGLAHMHSKGMAHNDIKPDNVMIDERTGEVKLIDMGITDRLGSKGDDFTPGFMAPEKDRGSSPQTDAFSTGAAAFNMTQGDKFKYNDSDQWDQSKFNYQFADIARQYAAGEKAVDTNIAPNRRVKRDGTDDPTGNAPGGVSVKNAGGAGMESAYTDFLNRILDPDPTKRLSPSDALLHPFLADRMLDDEKIKEVVKKSLGPSETPIQGKEPSRERYEQLRMRLPENLDRVGNEIAELKAAADGVDPVTLPAGKLAPVRGLLASRQAKAIEMERLLNEPMRMLDKVVSEAVVKDNEQHVVDRKERAEFQKLYLAATTARSLLEDRINRIDQRIQAGEVTQGELQGGFTAKDVATRKQALLEQIQSLNTIKTQVEQLARQDLSGKIAGYLHLKRELVAVKTSTAREQALTQGILAEVQRQAAAVRSPLGGGRGRANITAVNTVATDLNTHVQAVDALILDLDQKIVAVRGNLTQAGQTLDGLKVNVTQFIAQVDAHFQAEDRDAATLDAATKAERKSAAQVTAFNNARQAWENAEANHANNRTALRNSAETLIGSIKQVQDQYGMSVIGGLRDLKSEANAEIDRIKGLRRLYDKK